MMSARAKNWDWRDRRTLLREISLAAVVSAAIRWPPSLRTSQLISGRECVREARPVMSQFFVLSFVCHGKCPDSNFVTQYIDSGDTFCCAEKRAFRMVSSAFLCDFCTKIYLVTLKKCFATRSEYCSSSLRSNSAHKHSMSAHAIYSICNLKLRHISYE